MVSVFEDVWKCLSFSKELLRCLYKLCVVNSENIPNVSHYCDNLSVFTKAPSQRPLSILQTELHCAILFSMTVPTAGKTSELQHKTQ